MPPQEIFDKVPLPVLHYFEHCYYRKNGKQCRYANQAMNERYMRSMDPVLALAESVS